MSQKRISTSTSLAEDLVKFSKYKWEFLRRKKEYISDWDQFMKYREEVLNGKCDLDYYMHIQREFCIRWKIRYPFNPNLNYEDLVDALYRPTGLSLESSGSRHKKTDDFFHWARMSTGKYVLGQKRGLSVVDIPRLIYDYLFPEDDPGRPVIVIDGWRDIIDESNVRIVEDHVAESGKLTVRINLNYSKSKLKKEFKNLIDEWEILCKTAHKKFHYKKFCEEKDIHSFPVDEKLEKEFDDQYKKLLREEKKKYEHKYHFEDFNTYLQVYDLRKEGKSWATIKSLLGLNSVQGARNHHKAACKIIEKGIEAYVK